ncbi:amidase signature domain-containing protein [Aspergillus ambiguus]|uniref:putative general amidase n=1 Tax=Aspergillus ambiguus TaxID=176160 RepID=UPI003CCCAD23
MDRAQLQENTDFAKRVIESDASPSPVTRVEPKICLEGGALVVDGEGTLLATESSIINDNRNPDLSQDEIEAELRRLLGVEKIIWFPGNKGLDVTDVHVDAEVNFIRPGVVVLSRPHPSAPKAWWKVHDEIKAILDQSTDAKGRRFEIHIVDEPDPTCLGMLSHAESITETKRYQRVNVMNIPRTCGLLSSHELDITEKYDVHGLLRMIAEKRFSSEEVRAAIAQQLTRCLTEPLFDRAIERAKTLDDYLKQAGKPIGPLHGLPISIKDSFNVKGVDSTTGLAALAFKPATENSPLVDLLESLGAVIIAKTNIPQTLGALDSCNHLFGRTLNPLNRQLTAGGSTGGEGALLALRGSMVGFGTDIGGSIRIPAMCQGIYGFKPSVGRVPFAGQTAGHVPGNSRVALQAVAGPLARSVADLGAVMAEIVPRAERFAEDCIPGRWEGSFPAEPSRNVITIGVLRSDGLVEPLPPIARVLDEVAQTLRRTPGVEVVEIPVPAGLAKCQATAGRLMGADGGNEMMDLIEATGEPLIPWLQGRTKRGRELTVSQVGQLQAQRSQLEREMLKMWTTKGGHRVDAIIHPLAPHPVPELDRYNAVGYTSSFVLLDYPAGALPVRAFKDSDLELGKAMLTPELGSWDKANRKLWNEKTVDRRVYLDSPLSIQVVTPRQHDYDLFRAMEVIDRAIQTQESASTPSPRL